MLLVVCQCALALDPSLDVSQYAHTAWKVRDGFARGGIHWIAQTPDGYLWLGTEFGLLRFDGVRTVPWQPPDGEQLPNNRIGPLLVAHDGTLWIGTFKGLASWKDGKLTQYPETAGVYVLSLFEDREQTIWFGLYEASKGRLCRVRAAKVECYGEGMFGNGVVAIYQDHNGILWATSQTGLWRWAPGPPKQYAFPRGVVEANWIIEDDAGALLMATNGGLKQLVAGKIENYPLSGITGQFRPSRFYRSSDGSLWISTQQGLLQVRHGRVDGFGAVDGLSGDAVGTIFEDREGNIWVPTTDGLDRFREYPVPTISRNQGLSNSLANSVQTTPDGSVWISTPDGLNRWANGHVTVYRGRSALSENRAADGTKLNVSGAATEIANSGFVGTPQSLGLDDEGQLWVATGDGVFHFELNRFVRVVGVPGNILSIAGDGHGKVWLLHYKEGVFYWSPNAPTQHIPWSQFAQKLPRTMLPGREPGGFWLGFFNGGLVYLKDGKTVRSYGADDGLLGRVNHLRFGPNGGLWASTEGGLSRIKDGHIATMTQKNGLPCDEVHWSMEDDDHAVWLYMPCGLVRIMRSELDAWINDPKHVLKATVFDNSDGVRSVGIYGSYEPHVTKSPDGRIWFVPGDGVSVIDPRHLPFNKLAPPVHIEQITADHKTYEATPDANGQLRLPPRLRDLEIDYTALSLVAPERVLFRYKLEGWDRDWQDAGTRRQAFYSNLPPRNYSFRVKACNNSGVWNEAGTSLDFSVAPAYYQTNWFRLLCGAAFLALLWGLYHLRLRQLAREFNMRLDERVSERTRIARELHDTLLQNVQGLILKVHAVAKHMPPEEPSRQAIEKALDHADQVLAEGRDRVRNLRVTAESLSDLSAAFQRVAEETAPSRAATLRTVVEGDVRELHPVILEESYSIGREALINALVHSEGLHVEVEIIYDARQFGLRVRDDGRGINADILEKGGRNNHWGLQGMRERAVRIGAQLELWSRPGAGTEVGLTVPAAMAYRALAKSKSSWFRRSPGMSG
jgi:signal transduction histidine kinase/ligand-binding sensor domain-containing protein